MWLEASQISSNPVFCKHLAKSVKTNIMSLSETNTNDDNNNNNKNNNNNNTHYTTQYAFTD